MGSRIKCFMIEPTGRYRRWLRRYVPSYEEQCKVSNNGYHDAMVAIEDSDKERVVMGDIWPHDDPRWPTHCVCGREFAEEDTWQLFGRQIYTRPDTGKECTLYDAPPGAMWYADWYAEHERWHGPDGRSLWVMTPGGEWCVDGVASNCTNRADMKHKCWVRHGTPPDITVDKDGLTCKAGAGSIMVGGYHGFLHGGYLVD